MTNPRCLNCDLCHRFQAIKCRHVFRTLWKSKKLIQFSNPSQAASSVSSLDSLIFFPKAFQSRFPSSVLYITYCFCSLVSSAIVTSKASNLETLQRFTTQQMPLSMRPYPPIVHVGQNSNNNQNFVVFSRNDIYRILRIQLHNFVDPLLVKCMRVDLN